jgi:hypothetical protein
VPVHYASHTDDYFFKIFERYILVGSGS